MKFIPPMLSENLRDPARLEDPRYVAEPKFDGQRAQVHVEGGQTVAAYSRRSLDLLRTPASPGFEMSGGQSARRCSMAKSAAIPGQTASSPFWRPVVAGTG
jgi:ATP-dependent DNA ligase